MIKATASMANRNCAQSIIHGLAICELSGNNQEEGMRIAFLN
ncbi:hypothetical protein SynA18461_00191 [Synechococcus sp. A18-46.1]|nr:hypothetical protein SynA18461_00191 [Synechococcus sp. A18-46.1]